MTAPFEVTRIALVVLLGVASFAGCPCPERPPAGSPPIGRADAGVAADVGRWARAKDSAFAHGARWHAQVRAQCISDLGCLAPARIPSCQAGVNGIPARDVRSHAGKTVFVRGRLQGSLLRHGGASGPGCAQGRAAGGSLFIDYKIQLVDTPFPAAFECGGDASITCCGFEIPKRDIVARGVLSADASSMSDVSLCTLRSETDEPRQNGCEPTSGETSVLSDGRACSCYGGQMYCEFPGGCFRAGRWFDVGAVRPVSDSCAICRCSTEHRWECESRECARTAIEFPPGSAEISREQAERIGKNYFSNASFHFEISGYASKDEKAALANSRANSVAKIAERFGVPKERVEVRARGSFDPGPIASGHNRRVEIRLFETELPKPLLPVPP
jgi:hypothetical protein